MLELIILVGLQGAGKSSFYGKFFASTHAIVSKDLMKNKKHKTLHQEKLIRKYFSENKSVVMDNTNLTVQIRKDLTNIAKEYEAKVIVYYFPLAVSESLERNQGKNRKEVPPVAIYSAQKILELPSMREGFDECFTVRMTGPQDFEIQPGLLKSKIFQKAI